AKIDQGGHRVISLQNCEGTTSHRRNEGSRLAKCKKMKTLARG
ncbi:hypothetical protein V3C99_002634, partial [Haemonchus contortus]